MASVFCSDKGYSVLEKKKKKRNKIASASSPLSLRLSKKNWESELDVLRP